MFEQTPEQKAELKQLIAQRERQTKPTMMMDAVNPLDEKVIASDQRYRKPNEATYYMDNDRKTQEMPAINASTRIMEAPKLPPTAAPKESFWSKLNPFKKKDATKK